MPSSFLTIKTSPSVSPMTVTLNLLIFLTLFTEPGERPDMDEILSRFLSAAILEELPYVEGYCGEFREGITQQAGPRRISGSLIIF